MLHDRHYSLKPFIAIVALFVLCLASFPATLSANSKYAGLVIDADTGRVLYQDRANHYRYPASLTKMMTLYMTFEAIENGQLSMNKRLYVSRRAAAKPASKLGLRKGEYIRVKDAVMSLIVKSANDVSVVLAESIAGSEWKFAKKMTQKARSLGMSKTTFKNASGLHHRRQKTTAKDMARLSMALKRDFPQYYHLFKHTKFTYNGRTIYGHNRVVKSYKGADGLKTGYTRASGFNLATSASRNDGNIIGIVLGGKSSKSRDRHMKKILDLGFRKLAKTKRLNAVRFAKAPVPTLKYSTRYNSAVAQAVAPPSVYQQAQYSSNNKQAIGSSLVKPVLKTIEKTYNSVVPTLKNSLVSNAYAGKKEQQPLSLAHTTARNGSMPVPVYKPHPNYILSSLYKENYLKN